MTAEQIAAATLLELRDRYVANVELSKDMVGTLYPSILRDENLRIVDECVARTGYHPNLLAEKGLV
jgi:hypothetical protein